VRPREARCAALPRQFNPDTVAADIKAHGLLTVAGNSATLTVKKTRKDADGSSTETMTQSFELDGSKCSISR